MDRVGWLIPVRDAARWLGEAVRSALDECAPGDEVLVVDDGSRDDPLSVLPADPRLRVLHQPPLGIVAAMEHGRAALTTPLLARLDADDVALPGRIAAQRAFLAANPGVAAVGGRARMRADSGEVPEGMRVYTEWVNGLAEPRTGLLVESPLFHPAVLMRATAVEAVGGYRDGAFPEDYDLWLRLVEAGYGIAAVPQDVVLLRDRPGRLTRVDPRYARAAFFPLKREWVSRVLLRDRPRIVVWGAGQAGTPWIRGLVAEGHDVRAALDLKPGVSRHGVPIARPEALVDLEFDLLLVAVGARGARDEIRLRIAAMRPELVEGRDWWAVA
ncbi:MAG: glycosyltransferase [Pseudomonadota bacterium]|nr:glycosyltransferase [Pseudomonadota bacterium]